MTSAARTDPGLVRPANEDSLLVTDRLCAVADGLGGHVAGEVASAIATRCLAAVAPTAPLHPDDVVAAVAAANAEILEQVARDPSQTGMGTTLCGVGLVELDGATQCLVFNVGDSRVYRYASGRLEQVSVDHSEVQELVDAGQLAPADAAHYPRRNVITRCLGTEPAPTPDLWVYVPGAQERFLACSDGLSDELTDDDIAAILAAHADPEAAADALLAGALQAGGRDNVTVVVVDMANDDPPPPEASTEAAGTDPGGR